MKMIVCVSDNFGIGYKNDLLFSLPPDMKFFRETTLGKIVIMGRSTLDSFPGGNALKNRVNIVLTRDKDFCREGVLVFHSAQDILSHIEKYSSDDVYVIGGEQIYKLFERYCDTALVTRVRKKPLADKFFFNIDESANWQKDWESEMMQHDGTEFSFCRYIRK